MTTKWTPVENSTDEIIPSCALVRVTEVDEDEGVVIVAKPDTDSDANLMVLAGFSVPADPGDNSAYNRGEATYDNQVIVAYEEADGTPVTGESWGSAADSWKLRKNKTGFIILGAAGDGLVNAVRSSADTRDGRDPATVADCGVGCGWWAGMLDSWCLGLTVVSVAGECSTISTTQAFEMRPVAGVWRSRVWSDGSSAFVDASFAYGGGSGVAILSIDADGPHLTINGIELIRDCCGLGTAQFSGGSQLGLCNGTPPSTPCAENIFRVRVACECCSINGWEGPGWYCVDTGGGCPGVPLVLTENDRCDTDIVICTGPYDTEEDAEDDCEGIATDCADDPQSNGTATIHMTSGSCSEAGFSDTATYFGGGSGHEYHWDAGSGDPTPCVINCSGDVWTFTHTLLTSGIHFRKDGGSAPGSLNDGTVVDLSPFTVRFYGQFADNPFSGTWCDCYVELIIP